jgi:AcrR family transcriptional regulator
MNTSSSANALRFKVVLVLDRMTGSQSLEDITVRSICESAEITRSTFYRLFTDKYDVVNWYSNKLYSLGIEETGRTLTWADGLIVTLSAGLLIETLWVEAAKITGYDSLQETGIRARKESLTKTIVHHKRTKLTDLLAFQIDFYSEEESRIVTKWVSDKNRSTVEEISLLLETCVPSQLHELLKEPLDPRPAKKLQLADMILLV